MDCPTVGLGGWEDLPVKELDKQTKSALTKHIRDTRGQKIKKLQSARQKCVRGRLISVQYLAANGLVYAATIHEDIDRTYVRSVEQVAG